MPEKGFRKVPNPAKPSTHGHHPKPQPAELSTIPKPYDEHMSLDLAMGLKNRWDSYIQIRVRSFYSSSLRYPPQHST